MAYFWQDGDYMPGWGESTEFNFNVAVSECLFWMNIPVDTGYQITANRIYQPVGNGWTYEEGTWYYSDLNGAAVDMIEENGTMKVYPNPAAAEKKVKSGIQESVRDQSKYSQRLYDCKTVV